MQRAWFDALSPEEKRKAIQKAIEEGFASPGSTKSIDDVIPEARAVLLRQGFAGHSFV
jgi:hypothetical protein